MAEDLTDFAFLAPNHERQVPMSSGSGLLFLAEFLEV
jgi:hypothetical protein